MRERKTELAKETNLETKAINEDEISLVDLAVTILKRRKVFYIAFCSLLLVTIFFTAITFLNKSEHITSVYQVALEGDVAQQPAVLVEITESFYKDLVLTELNEISYAKIEVKVNNPRGTNYILLDSEIAEKDLEKVKTLHSKILEKVKEGQDKVLAKDLKNLEDQLQASRQELELIRKEKEDMRNVRHEKAPEALVGFTSQIIALESRIRDMEKRKFYFKEGEVVQIGQKKLAKLGSGASKVLGIGLVFSFVVGLVSVFIYEFVQVVKQRLNEKNV